MQIPPTTESQIHGPEIAKECPQISELQVQMSVELARIKITLADLAKIETGHQVMLPINALSDVRLKPQGGGPEYQCSLGRHMGSRAVQMILDTAANPAMDAVYDADTPVLDAETAVLITSQSSEDRDVEDVLDQDWLEALADYDDAADQDVIDGAA